MLEKGGIDYIAQYHFKVKEACYIICLHLRLKHLKYRNLISVLVTLMESPHFYKTFLSFYKIATVIQKSSQVQQYQDNLIWVFFYTLHQF